MSRGPRGTESHNIIYIYSICKQLKKERRKHDKITHSIKMRSSSSSITLFLT
jgi:hypothetical protein